MKTEYNSIISLGKELDIQNTKQKKREYNDNYKRVSLARKTITLLNEVMQPNSNGRYDKFKDTNKCIELDSYIKKIKGICTSEGIDFIHFFVSQDIILSNLQRKALILLLDVNVATFGGNLFKFQFENNKRVQETIKLNIEKQLLKYGLSREVASELVYDVYTLFAIKISKNDTSFETLQHYQYISTLVMQQVHEYYRHQNRTANDNTINYELIVTEYENAYFNDVERVFYLDNELAKFENALQSKGIDSLFDFMTLYDNVNDKSEKRYLRLGVSALLEDKLNLTDYDIKIIRQYIANEK